MLGPSHPSPNPPAVFFTPLSCYRGGKKEPGVHAETVPPPHRKYFCPVSGTGKKAVYGYSSIQRGDSGTKYVTPHRTPPPPPPSAVFHSPLCKLDLLVRTSKGSPAWGLSDVHARTPYLRKTEPFLQERLYMCIGFFLTENASTAAAVPEGTFEYWFYSPR